MRSVTSLLAGLFALVSLQTPTTAEASHKKHKHYSGCTHQNTVVVRPGKKQYHQHKSTSVVVVTSSTPTYTYYPYYGYRRYYTTPAPQPTYAQPPMQPAVTKPVVQNSMIREFGARFIGGGSVEGEQASLIGAGAYLRVRNTGRLLGFEASVDSTAVLDAAGNAVANQVPIQAAALLYLNPRAPLRVFGLAGGGVTLEQSAIGPSQGITAQIGAGLDLDIAPRATFSLDIRGTSAESASVETRILPVDPTPNTTLLMNMGLSFKF